MVMNPELVFVLKTFPLNAPLCIKLLTGHFHLDI